MMPSALCAARQFSDHINAQSPPKTHLFAKGYAMLDRLWISVVTATLTFHTVFSVSLVSAQSLADVIKEVQSNETLYKNLEIEANYEYDSPFIRESVEASGGKKKEDSPKFYAGQSYQWRSVSQGEMFRVDRQGNGTGTEGEKLNANRINGFDGHSSKLLEQDGYGNIAKFAIAEPDLVRPHMLLLKPFKILAPLSTFLSGTDSLMAHPNSGWKSHWSLQVSMLQEEIVDGSPTYVLKLDNLIRGTAHDGYKLWLSKEHNCIPVQFHAYTYRFSETQPLSKGTVTDWIKVEDGVWFPKTITITAFDPKSLMEEGKVVVRWTNKIGVNSVNLNPRHPEAFFTDIKFPDGVAVYELNAEKKVERSYRTADPTKEISYVKPNKSPYIWMIVYGVNGAICIAIITIIARKISLHRQAKLGS